MIDLETKKKLLKEIAKSGNVSLSCLKVNVDKSTFYEWKKNDKGFQREANNALKLGRENNCDIAEHALLLKVKDKDLGSIKYLLAHNSNRYKPKVRKVVIEHSRTTDAQEKFEQERREFFDQQTEMMRDTLEMVKIAEGKDPSLYKDDDEIVSE